MEVLFSLGVENYKKEESSLDGAKEKPKQNALLLLRRESTEGGCNKASLLTKSILDKVQVIRQKIQKNIFIPRSIKRSWRG